MLRQNGAEMGTGQWSRTRSKVEAYLHVTGVFDVYTEWNDTVGDGEPLFFLQRKFFDQVFDASLDLVYHHLYFVDVVWV